MKALSTEKTMTVKEVSKSLETPLRTVHNAIKRIYPFLKKNGKTTYLNESQVSNISKELKRAHNIDLASTRKVATTETEENEIVLNAMFILNRRKIELEKQIEEMKPKADFFDSVIDSSSLISMNEASKVLAIKGYGRTNLFKLLRDEKLLLRSNEPYQTYIDRGYFKLIETSYEINGSTRINTKTMVTQKGLNHIRKVIERVSTKQLESTHES